MSSASAKPRPRSNLTDLEIMKILTLHRDGHSQREIAEIVHRSKGAIEHTLKTYRFDTFVGHHSRPKYHRKTTQREDRYLLRAARQFNDVPLHDISKIVNIPVSRSTVSRRLHEKGYRRYVARQKPYLSSENKHERLQWAIAHRDWTKEKWKKVIWSDETLLQVGHSSRRRWVTRRKGEELDSKNIYPTYKSGRVTLMVWACFTGEKVGPLMIFDKGGVGSDEYMEVILDGLLSFVDDILEQPEEDETIRVHDENTFIFMQDNVSCHKTTEILDLLREEGIPIMKWPAQSPDLNPLENLWADFKDRFHSRFLQLYRRPSRSQEALHQYRELAKQVWEEQGSEMIEHLINSMTERCELLIAAGGGLIDY